MICGLGRTSILPKKIKEKEMMMKQLQRNRIYFVLLVIKKQTKINKQQPRKAQIAVGSSQKTLHPSLKCENMSHTSGQKARNSTSTNFTNVKYRREEKIKGMSDLRDSTIKETKHTKVFDLENQKGKTKVR